MLNGQQKAKLFFFASFANNYQSGSIVLFVRRVVYLNHYDFLMGYNFNCLEFLNIKKINTINYLI